MLALKEHISLKKFTHHLLIWREAYVYNHATTLVVLTKTDRLFSSSFSSSFTFVLFSKHTHSLKMEPFKVFSRVHWGVADSSLPNRNMLVMPFWVFFFLVQRFFPPEGQDLLNVILRIFFWLNILNLSNPQRHKEHLTIMNYKRESLKRGREYSV